MGNTYISCQYCAPKLNVMNSMQLQILPVTIITYEDFMWLKYKSKLMYVVAKEEVQKTVFGVKTK